MVTQAPAAPQAPARIVVNGVQYVAVQAPAPVAAPVAAARPAYAVTRALAPVAPTQLAAAPRPATAMCDGLLANGCYLAKRKFSTPRGPELRCTIVCE
jgi:hypothetical protein